MAAMSEYLRSVNDHYIFDQDSWIHFIEDHLDYITDKSTFIEVEPDDAWRFRGDLIAFLYDKGVPNELHYPLMRINGYIRPEEFDENVRFLRKPTEATIHDLSSDYVNTHRY